MAGKRLAELDRVRGLAMVLMALDHTRDYFGDWSVRPTDLAHASVALFFTRWVTHFCAPVFVLLAGTAAYLHGRKLENIAALSRFLVTRGLWLVVLELTVVRFGWNAMIFRRDFTLQVIWALGCSMVCLSLLHRLPRAALIAVGVLLCAGHNLLDRFDPGGLFWSILHVSRRIPVGPLRVFVLYPLLPWIGLMALGYALGPVFELESERRKRVLLSLGMGAIALFAVVRGTNVYGDLLPWSVQSRAGFTFLSMLNCAKYPPSLSYLLMTIGPALCLLALWTREQSKVSDRFALFGRVPLFYYVIHLPMLQFSAAGFLLSRVGLQGVQAALASGRGNGLSLWGVYLVWGLLLLLLYPACRWFAGIKQRRNDWWLSYM